MNKRKLSNYFIYPSFQFALLISNIFVSGVTILIVRFKVNEVFDKLFETGKTIKLPSDHPYFNFINNSKSMMALNLNWALGFSIFLTIICSIYISHKAVGPIYQLKKYFKNMQNGDKKTELTFRRGDYFDDLPEIINSALKKCKKD